MSGIHHALAQLPDEERRLLELTYWTALSSEVAAELGLRPAEMHGHMRRVLAQLAALLDGVAAA